MSMHDKQWNAATEQGKLAHIAILSEIIGPHFIVNDMDAEKARSVRDIIKQLPKNRNKNPSLRNLSLEQTLEVTNAPKIAQATVKQYLETYNSLFAWCVAEGYIEKNHFDTLRGRRDRNREDIKRDPFTDEQIRTMLTEVGKGRDGLANKDYRYWGTLIGIYTGARLNEISQILLDDIKQEGGIWYFDMNDDGDNKKLKNEASRRYVPIHKALLEGGLIEYRDKLKKQGKDRLLHELTYCKRNGWGKKLGHFFNQVFLVKLNMKKPELVYHSLRHTAVTRLLQADIDMNAVQMIVGHTLSGGATTTYFKEGHKLAYLKDAIDKLHPV